MLLTYAYRRACMCVCVYVRVYMRVCVCVIHEARACVLMRFILFKFILKLNKLVI